MAISVNHRPWTMLSGSCWILVVSGILVSAGCCVRVGPHETFPRPQPITARSSCDCRQSHCVCKTSPVSGLAKVNVSNQAWTKATNVAPPDVPALTKVARPALFSSKNAATTLDVQNKSAGVNGRNSTASSRTHSENQPATIDSLPTPKSFEVRKIPESKNASTTRQIDAPAALELPESEPIIPVTRPSNTLIHEIDAHEELVPGIFDQSSQLPATVTPKLTALFGDNSGDSMQTSATDDPATSGPTTRTIMFAVPRLSPANIQSTARIVSIGEPQISQSSRRPYTLSVAPSLGDSQAQPIAPVLDELRTGRRIELPQTAPIIRR